MGRRRAAHTVAWTDQVAALVRDHTAHAPLSTNQLADLAGLNPYERGTRLWPALDRLARDGHITRIPSPHGGCRQWQWNRSR
ncbi:MAG TPA: hypothetical protein VIP77_04925 [Jiangellaceae bacterium]